MLRWGSIDSYALFQSSHSVRRNVMQKNSVSQTDLFWPNCQQLVTKLYESQGATRKKETRSKSKAKFERGFEPTHCETAEWARNLKERSNREKEKKVREIVNFFLELFTFQCLLLQMTLCTKFTSDIFIGMSPPRINQILRDPSLFSVDDYNRAKFGYRIVLPVSCFDNLLKFRFRWR